MAIPFDDAVLLVFTVLPTIGMSYYASKMLLLTRFGRLESGWKLVTAGATLAPIGLTVLALQDFTQSYSLLYVAMDYLGTIPCAIGLLLLMLGVRSQLSIWSGASNPRINDPMNEVEKS